MTGLFTNPLKILLVAVEPSGDALGAALYTELKFLLPEGTEFYGCGGLLMTQAGFPSAFPTDSFSVIGLTGFLKAIPEGVKRAKQIGRIAQEHDVDLAVYIDAWAFSWRAARYTRLYSPRTKTIKYATPQVWASRPGRVQTVKSYFDHVLNLLPFEPQYFHAAGISAEFTGNPNFQLVYNQDTDEGTTIDKYNLTDQSILTVLPGSRKSEIQLLARPFNETISKLQKLLPHLQVVIPAAPAVADLVRDEFGEQKNVKFIDPEDRFSIFKLSDAALAASGTVSTELAIAKTPMVVAYKVDALTYAWAKCIALTECFSILNIAAGEELIPEFIQHDCEAEHLVPALHRLLCDDNKRQKQKEAFISLLDDLAINDAPAAQRAAKAIVNQLR